MSIFDQNVDFWPKCRFLTKMPIFDLIFRLFTNFRFFTKISIFDQNFGFDKNFDFWPKCRFFTIFFKFRSKFPFSAKIDIFGQNSVFIQIYLKINISESAKTACPRAWMFGDKPAGVSIPRSPKFNLKFPSSISPNLFYSRISKTRNWKFSQRANVSCPSRVKILKFYVTGIILSCLERIFLQNKKNIFCTNVV